MHENGARCVHNYNHLPRLRLSELTNVQHRGITAVPWLGETKSLGDFTLILNQVCSPGPVTDVELIISLTGLYWIFTVCASWASSRNGDDLMDQASVCQSSLEVMLSNMNFWVPTTIDAVLAMYLAVRHNFPVCYASFPRTMLNRRFYLSLGSVLSAERQNICLVDTHQQGGHAKPSTGPAYGRISARPLLSR